MTALLRLLLPSSGRVALAVGLGVAVIASNMGLLAAAAYLIATASILHLMALLLIPMYAVRLLSVTRGAARYAERLASHRVTFDLLARLRVELFDRFRSLGPAGMQGTHSGDSLGRAMGDVEELQNAYLMFVSPLGVALAVSTLLICVLRAFGDALAWAALCFVAAGAVLLPLTVHVLARRAGHALVAARAELSAHLVDSIQGSCDILSNGAGTRYLAHMASHGQRLARAEARLAAVTAGREGAADLLTNLAMLTALALAVPLVTRHALSALYLAVPALLTLAGFEAIRPLGQAAETASSVQASAERVLSLGDRHPRGSSLHSVTPSCSQAPPMPELRPPYSVTFEDVTLDYSMTPSLGSGIPSTRCLRPALQRVSFDVPAGGHVAVVGPSGAGKTTLVRLLSRAWEPTEGHIRIGDTDVRRCTLHDLRAALAVVTQDTYVFNDTIRNNLLLARPDASTSDLEAALHEVDLLEPVRTMPQGLDTWVGEHGGRLSGGERQRLAVARVLLQDAPIVLIDEVTANLDPRSESALLDLLYRVTEGRTLLAITHRLVRLNRMDEIVVLDRGRVVERGTHECLCAAGGLYRRMLEVQEDMIAL